MMPMPIFYVRTAVFALMLAAAVNAGACPEKVPSGLHPVSVGDGLTVNGLGVAILQVEGRQSAASVLDRMEKEWSEAGYAVKRNQAEGWNVVSALSDKCMTTLQLVERGGAFGYMAVNRFARPVAAALPSTPMPSGATVLSSVQSDDDGRKGRTTVLAAPQSVQQLAVFYKRQLEQDRWSAVRVATSTGADGVPSRANLSAQRGRERVEVVIVREAGSKVVINVATQL